MGFKAGALESWDGGKRSTRMQVLALEELLMPPILCAHVQHLLGKLSVQEVWIAFTKSEVWTREGRVTLVS